MQEKPCPSCGAIVPDIDGPTHRYMESSPGCWSVYGEVLAREYSDVVFARKHRLTVDAYAVQHPGHPTAQSIQSVCIHLVSLHLVLDRGIEQAVATNALQRMAGNKEVFEWLEPPTSLGPVTVNDVRAATSPDEHAQAVTRWAQSVWQAWSEHHPSVRKWGLSVVPP